MGDRQQCYIHTFGCQMNVRDSELVRGLMEEAGYDSTGDLEAADLVIVNTCSVRAKAEQKAHSLIGRMRRLKKQRSGLVVGVMGCMAQQWGRNFFDRSPQVDFVCGTHAMDRIPAMVRAVREGCGPQEDTAFRDHPFSLSRRACPPRGALSAYVTIMQGCDNFCSYCIVPHVRGREQSRRSVDIVEEVAGLAAAGVREVTLLGQNVNSYGRNLEEPTDFPSLLRRVASVKGLERIRFTTSHPKDLSKELAACFAELEALCDHIHLPLQSGSTKVLRLMKRDYGADEYCEKVALLRSLVPSISITTDIIVGFPGETDGDFQKTIDLMEKVRFDSAFSFKYSDRPGTAAAGFDGALDEAVKNQRLQVLQKLQARHTVERNRSLEGSVKEVLVEGPSKGSPDDCTGRTRCNRIVNFTGSELLRGRTVPVKIIRGYAHSLRGEIPGKEAENPLCL